MQHRRQNIQSIYRGISENAVSKSRGKAFMKTKNNLLNKGSRGIKRIRGPDNGGMENLTFYWKVL